MRAAAAICVVVVSTCACRPSDRAAQKGPAARAEAPKSDSAGPSLLTDWGRHHHPIRTSVPAAQQFFDQGMSLVFAFNHEEATRSFQHAAELDPMAAMPAATPAEVEFKVVPVIGNKEILFVLTSPIAQAVLHGKISGKKLTITITDELQQPAPAPTRRSWTSPPRSPRRRARRP